MALIDEYNDYEFADETIEAMAKTFESDTATAITSGAVSESQASQAGVELFQLWKTVAQDHGVSGEYERKSLVLQGMEQHMKRSLGETIIVMASWLEDM